MIVLLPFPNKWLNPNARNRWALIQARKSARKLAWQETMVNGGMHEERARLAGTFDILLTVTITPPDRRPRDRDNMIASLKSHFDGIADALHVNDNRFTYQFHFAEPCKPGTVVVAL